MNNMYLGLFKGISIDNKKPTGKFIHRSCSPTND